MASIPFAPSARARPSSPSRGSVSRSRTDTIRAVFASRRDRSGLLGGGGEGLDAGRGGWVRAGTTRDGLAWPAREGWGAL